MGSMILGSGGIAALSEGGRRRSAERVMRGREAVDLELRRRRIKLEPNSIQLKFYLCFMTSYHTGPRNSP